MAGDEELDDLLELAGCCFRDAMRAIDIEAFFSRRDVPLAEGTSKKTVAQNTLASLPRAKALDLALEFARERRDIGLQDRVYLLQDKDQPEISAITRDRVADRLGVGIHGQGIRPDVIEGLFDLSSPADFFEGPTKTEELRQYATGAAPLWNAKEVFEFIGAITCPSRRFAQLIETALDPRFRDADDQAALAADLTRILQLDGYEVAQTGEVSGRATFSVRPVRRGVDGRPKNLIFASNGPKPRLGFSDAIDNEVVVLEHVDSCLIYERPIGNGLSWLDLVRWWMEQKGLADLAEARTSLGRRLLASLDHGPEQEFFKAYFRNFAERLGDQLPALIPQVYLHYDPEIARRLADKRVLFRQRMDFLMLLPGRQRVVLEIDGKHHYAKGERADPGLYAEMVAADRNLRLRGYEVFRFGGSEFSHPKGSMQESVDELVKSFFEELFVAHRVGSLIGTGTGRRRAVVSLPTGGGKTRVAAEAVVRLVLKGDGRRTALWIAQTDELCEQAVQCFRQLWVNVGEPGEDLRIVRLWGGQRNPSPPEGDEPTVVIASIQTLNSRSGRPELAWVAQTGIIVIDECHHAITSSYTDLLRWLDVQVGSERAREREAPVLGLSATPWRGYDEDESERLAARFDRRWFPADQAGLHDKLSKMGVLADRSYRPLRYDRPITLTEREQQHVDTFGELPDSVVDRMGEDSDRNDLIIDAIVNSKAESILLFANSVAHAQYLAARLHLAGCPAAAVSGQTDRLARQHFTRRFRAGDLRVICNHSVLTTGFDAPKADMVLISRPVFSPVLYMQMVGRGLRGPANGGTTHCEIMTVEDNILNFRDRLAYHFCRRFFDT